MLFIFYFDGNFKLQDNYAFPVESKGHIIHKLKYYKTK